MTRSSRWRLGDGNVTLWHLERRTEKGSFSLQKLIGGRNYECERGATIEPACQAKSPLSTKPERGVKAGAGIEPANSGFADRDLTTWLPRRRSEPSG
jgi:hypothetical protein